MKESYLRLFRPQRVKQQLAHLLAICLICLVPVGAFAQVLKISMKKSNVSMETVLQELEQKSGYSLFYNDNRVKLNKKVSINVTDASLTSVLNQVFNNSGYTYKIVENQIVISTAPTASVRTTQNTQSTQQKKAQTIKGIVKDALGEAVIGASIIEKGTGSNGTITNLDGEFTLTVSGNEVQVTYIGFTPQTIALKPGVDFYNVMLKEDSKALDEVVVVGYGKQRKSSITGSVTTINADKLKDITTPSVSGMLQGKVAGVVVTPESGQPGAATTIRVRGTGSIRGVKNPLWVIDGVVGDAIADLNPNDIETISVLKDGSATALYGSRGANGVIQVTTKRATMGISQVDASVKFGVSQLQKGNLRMMNGTEYYDYLKTAYENAGTLENQHSLQPYLKDMNTDWWDIGTQNALTQNYNIGYRFGSDKIRSYISADYYNEEGTIKGFTLDRFTLRANTDYIVNKRLTIKSKISASYRETDNQEHSLSYTSYSPWDTPYNSKGELKSGKESVPTAEQAPTADPRDYWYSDGGYNYLYDRDLNWQRSRRNAMDIGLGFDYKIFEFLTFESNNKVGFSNSYTTTYTDPESSGGQAKKGTVNDYNYNNRAIYTSQMLRFLKTFGDKHEVNAFLGYDYDAYSTWNNTGESSNIFIGSEILSGGSANYKASGGKSEEKNAAYFFNGNYAFDSKYLFQASYRVDGSSRFGSNKRWASFWSIGGGWNMHKEKFMSRLEFINELKPRISYGITGNLPDGAYEWSTKFNTTMEYDSQVAFYSNYSGNPNLSWEQTNSFGFGLDIRLFNRVNIVFDSYSKRVKNLIYLRHMPAVTGFNRQTANDGKLKNTGYEITVTPEIIKTKDWYWDLSFNLGYNRNEITHMPDGDVLATSQAIAVGYPYQNWYLREWAGVDAMTGNPLWFKVNEETGAKTVTENYSDATRVLLDSSSSPNFNGGFSSNLTWKGITLNANFTFSAGAMIYNGQRAGSLDRDATRPTQPGMRLADGWSRWEKPGDIATHPRLIAGGNNKSSEESTRYLESGDYFKLKSISISYALPKRLLKPVGLNDLRLSMGGENLFTITKFSGVDPEILLSSRYNGTTTSSSGQVYPSVRRFTIGLNLNF